MMMSEVDETFFYRDIIFNILNRNCKYQLRSMEKFGDNQIIVSFLDGTIKSVVVK